MTKNEHPTHGVFIVWDVEEVDVERKDAGTVHDRTVVNGRRTVPMRALWSNTISAATIEAAERYAGSSECRDYEHARVEVICIKKL